MALDAAVRPGVHLPDHARHLRRVHHAVVSGSRPAHRPRPVVERSWRRVLDLGLRADGGNARDPLPAGELHRLRRESPLLPVVDELGHLVNAVPDAGHVLFVVTDADGIILWRNGSAAVRAHADRLGFVEGAEWTERRVGTNAIGTALAEAAPVELFSAEHFEETQHPWYCSATPVHDPRTGALLGVLDVSGPAMTLHPAIGALVATACRLAEARLRDEHSRRLDALRRAGGPALAGCSGPALVVDDDGWVATSIGVTTAERVEVPAEGRPITVPGVGLCLPERLDGRRDLRGAGGWLVRPWSPAGGAGPRLRLVLDLRGDPVLELSGEEAGWRRPLTTRHAEILLLLHRAGPAGLGAEALSRALFGDADHVVSVRAEVSRLRRAAGAVVRTRPYRTDPAVVTEVLTDGPLASTPLVRTSTSPGVRALVDVHG